MIISVPSTIKLHEAVTTLQIASAAKAQLNWPSLVEEFPVPALMRCAGFSPSWTGNLEDELVLDYAAAEKCVEDTDKPYCFVLSSQLQEELALECPKFPFIQPSEDAGIILSPFGLKPELNLPRIVWKAVVRHLRTYGQSVMLLGEPGERLDIASFSEAENISNWEMNGLVLEGIIRHCNDALLQGFDGSKGSDDLSRLYTLEVAT